MNVHANPAATATVIPLPTGRRRLAEASIIPIAGAASAIVFDTASDAARTPARLTALFAGEPMRGPSLSTSLELRSGGRRHLILVGRSAPSLAGLTITLALGSELAAIVDGEWLQPPLADGAALVRGLAEPGRRRLLKLFLTTGASLFGRGAPGFADAARRLVDLVGAPATRPASWCRIGAAGRLISYRLPADAGAGLIEDLIGIAETRVTRLSGWQHSPEASPHGPILHLYVPGPLPAGATLVGLGPSQLNLVSPDDDLAPKLLVPWLSRRSTPTQAWTGELLRSVGTDPTAAALLRELQRGTAAAPVAAVRHLSATRHGLLFALDLADPCDLVRSIRIERGGAATEIVPTSSVAGFAALPRSPGEDDSCRVRLLQHSGRTTTVYRGQPAAFSGEIPAGWHPGHAAAMAEARLDLDRIEPGSVETFGTPPAEPPLALVAGVGETLDIIRARAALLFAEPRGRSVEIAYHVAEGPLADAARAAIVQAQAVTGIAHRLAILPPGASATDRLRAALDATSAPRILSVGADVLPTGTGWLAPWLAGLGEARPILGGTLLDAAGSVADAGGAIAFDGEQLSITRRAVGWPSRDLPRGTAATALVSAECVGLTRSVADLLSTAIPHYPDPDVMLAIAVQATRRRGADPRTLCQPRFVRYAAPARPDPLAAAVDAQALALLLKAFFRSAGDQGEP